MHQSVIIFINAWRCSSAKSWNSIRYITECSIEHSESRKYSNCCVRKDVTCDHLKGFFGLNHRLGSATEFYKAIPQNVFEKCIQRLRYVRDVAFKALGIPEYRRIQRNLDRIVHLSVNSCPKNVSPKYRNTSVWNVTHIEIEILFHDFVSCSQE